MELKIICWLVLIFIGVMIPECRSQSQSAELGSYMDRCSRSSPCDEEQNLSCSNGFCRCSDPDEMMYDYVRERCAIREGQRCRTPRFDFGEFNPCVSNAFCADNRLCTCSQYSFSDGSGLCLQKKYFNETCKGNRECDNFRYLQCIDGQCLCDRFTTHDEYFQLCRRRAGESCRRTRECVKNADCIDNKCICKKNYIEASDKTCGLTYGQSCSGNGSENPCSDVYYACINGRCQCKNPSYELYDRKTKSCLSLVGGLCHLFMSNNRQPLRLKNCVQHAECVRRELSALSQCECEKGYVETVSGKCQLAFGEACDTRSEEDGGQCDESVPLFCRNGKCECQNEFDLYDRTERACRRMVGSLCNKSTDTCAFNASCEKGRCRCDPGYTSNFRGMCEKEEKKKKAIDTSSMLSSKELTSQELMQNTKNKRTTAQDEETYF